MVHLLPFLPEVPFLVALKPLMREQLWSSSSLPQVLWSVYILYIFCESALVNYLKNVIKT